MGRRRGRGRDLCWQCVEWSRRGGIEWRYCIGKQDGHVAWDLGIRLYLCNLHDIIGFDTNRFCWTSLHPQDDIRVYDKVPYLS